MIRSLDWVSKKGSFLLRPAMACLFSCLRLKEDSSSTSHLPSTSTEVGAKKRSSLSALLLSEECGLSQFEEKKSTTAEAEFDVKELKDEARFLKACGTLPETPAEIRKFSKERKNQSSGKGETEHRKFRSWLTDTSTEMLNLENQPDQLPTPVNKSDELVEGIVSSEQTPSSCMTEGRNTRTSTCSAQVSGIQNVNTPDEVHATQNYKSATPLVSNGNLAPNVPGRTKSVRFDCESSLSSISSESSSSENKILKDFEAAGNFSVSKPSPYPTPLKLSDEMQTPGTVFPAYVENMANGKKSRIRSQYAYSVLNPVENFSQWNVLKDEGSDSNQQSSQSGKSFEQVDVGSPLEKGMRDTSVGKELNLEASLSTWLKSPVTNPEGNNYSTAHDNVRFGRALGDRPILGMVAAHWNEDDEPSRISPKSWDGNGIPNSTNKYKEDQKVSWHATPFEERLEKALSEETFLSQRKQISGTPPPVDFGETEESDTALSKLHSSSNFKSIVSC